MSDQALELRDLQPDELDLIASLHAMSFEQSDHGHHGEADLVRALHDEGDATVSLVAELDGKVVGHVLFSRMAIEADGVAVAGVALAPVAVLPGYRRQGIGAALVRAGHRRLCERDVAISFVLGAPAYYQRFGYEPALAAPFASLYAGRYFMAVALAGSMPCAATGRAEHAPAFARLG